MLCISVPELQNLLGEDLGRVLETGLVLKAMQALEGNRGAGSEFIKGFGGGGGGWGLGFYSG